MCDMLAPEPESAVETNPARVSQNVARFAHELTSASQVVKMKSTFMMNDSSPGDDRREIFWIDFVSTDGL